jgi:hypothetical protein
MASDQDTSFARGPRMDKPKQHARRANILNFQHMSRKEEQLLQTVLNNMSQAC